MQYLLTKEEYEKLIPEIEVLKRDEALAFARKKILELSGFSCIHVSRDGYCDGCPCVEKGNKYLCFLRKDFSK